MEPGRDVGRILLVEDDVDARRALRETLCGAGYRVIEAEGVENGYLFFQKERPDLAVLDLELPDGSGLELCRRIRAHKTLSATPIIILTGKSRMDDKETGFEAGADQYLVKPVPPQELRLWVRALLKRLSMDRGEGSVLESGDLVIDEEARLVRHKGRAITDLTAREFDLLCALVKRQPRILSRKTILSAVWRTVAVDCVVDAHISHLRRKLGPELADRIQNVPGKGFRYFA